MPKSAKSPTMQIGKDYKLTSDSMNIILSRKQVSKKNGTEYWKNEAYFSNPKNALKYIVDQQIREVWVGGLETITKRQDELYRLIGKIPPEALTSMRKGMKD